MLDADADRADLELRLIKLILKDRARVDPFADNGSSCAKRTFRPAWQLTAVAHGIDFIAQRACPSARKLVGLPKQEIHVALEYVF